MCFRAREVIASQIGILRRLESAYTIQNSKIYSVLVIFFALRNAKVLKCIFLVDEGIKGKILIN